MDYLNPIYTEKAACQDCYKCLRQCTVKAIRVEQANARVIGEACTLCGHCVAVCPVGAKKVRDDSGRLRPLLERSEPTFALVAPSFVADFPGLSPEQLVAAIKVLGFSGVAEVALGADLVSQEAGRIIDAERNARKLFISTACPTIVAYLERYRPELVGSLLPVKSPLQACAGMIRHQFGPAAKVVFFGPCIAKKIESDRQRELIDTVLSFRDLARLWLGAGIDPWSCRPDGEGFCLPRPGRGVLYPIDGGMIAAVKRHVSFMPLHAMSFSGIEHVRLALAGIDPAVLPEPLFLELLACEGGCINGPQAIGGDGGTIVKRMRVVAQPVKGGGRRPAGLDLSAAWRARLATEGEPGAAAIIRALHSVGKTSLERELNCSACGYDSCRDFARALCVGRAEATMCVSHMRDLVQKKANALLRTMPAGVVILDRELRVLECNANFARIIGGDVADLYEAKPGLAGADGGRLVPNPQLFTAALESKADSLEEELAFEGRYLRVCVFSIEPGAVVGGLFQDITWPTVQRDQVADQAQRVIEKHLSTVQQIAYLLGENAAESEAILNSIIQSFAVPAWQGKNDARLH